MKGMIRIGIIGDYDPDLSYHRATTDAVGHAGAALGIQATPEWIPTESVAGGDPAGALDGFHGLWCSPGSPYRSMEGALAAIRFARERRRPFVGT